MTRLKDDLRGEVMIFKEAEWQTLRIEANALDIGDPLLSTTPLRLIANQSKIRVTIKKRISGTVIILTLDYWPKFWTRCAIYFIFSVLIFFKL